MKAIITRSKAKIETLKYDQLQIGKLYNYAQTGRYSGENKGVVFCSRDIDNGTKRLVEFVGPDESSLWGRENAHAAAAVSANFVFTPFTDKLTLSND